MFKQVLFYSLLAFFLSGCCKTKDRVIGFERLAFYHLDDLSRNTLDSLNRAFNLYVACEFDNIQSCGTFSAQVIENELVRESMSLSLDTSFTINAEFIESGTNWLSHPSISPFMDYNTFYCFDLEIDPAFFEQAVFPSGDRFFEFSAASADGFSYQIEKPVFFNF